MKKKEKQQNTIYKTTTSTNIYVCIQKKENKRIKTVCKVTKQHVSVHKNDQTIRRNVVRLSRRNRTLLLLSLLHLQKKNIQLFRNSNFNNDKEPKDEEEQL